MESTSPGCLKKHARGGKWLTFTCFCRILWRFLCQLYCTYTVALPSIRSSIILFILIGYFFLQKIFLEKKKTTRIAMPGNKLEPFAFKKYFFYVVFQIQCYLLFIKPSLYAINWDKGFMHCLFKSKTTLWGGYYYLHFTNKVMMVTEFYAFYWLTDNPGFASTPSLSQVNQALQC